MDVPWWFRSALISGVAVAALATASDLASAQSSPPSLFIERGADPAMRAPQRPDAVRSRRLSVRADLLTAALTPGRGAAAPFVLNLFPDVALTLVRERLEIGVAGHTTWVGAVTDDAESLAALTWDGRTLVGGVVTRGVAYDITADGDGAVSVSQRATAEHPVELAPRVPAHFATARGPAIAAADGATAAIDVLVLYTPAARQRAGGRDQIVSQLTNAVAVTNTAFARSGVNAVLSAVGIEELPYVEAAGIASDLSAISLGGTQSATVEARRADVGADLVALVTGRPSSSGGCGTAWIGPSTSAAYSASEQACLYAGQWSFTHEIGHNLGADHAPGDSAPVGASYARGYRDGTIRTLMAYAVYGSPLRTLNFSSATVREPAVTGAPTGTSLQDNARRLSETVAAVASYVAGDLSENCTSSADRVDRQRFRTARGAVVDGGGRRHVVPGAGRPRARRRGGVQRHRDRRGSHWRARALAPTTGASARRTRMARVRRHRRQPSRYRNQPRRARLRRLGSTRRSTDPPCGSRGQREAGTCRGSKSRADRATVRVPTATSR